MSNKMEIAMAVAEITSTLANEVNDLRSDVKSCKRYIDDVHQRRDDLIETLDKIISQQSGDLHADVQGIHDRLVSDWTKKPYFIRRDY